MERLVSKQIALLFMVCSFALTSCDQNSGVKPEDKSGAAEAKVHVGEATGLSAYIGKYPYEKRDEKSFWGQKAVVAVATAALNNLETPPSSMEGGVESPIEAVGDGFIFASACEPHNCDAHNWAVVIDKTGSRGFVCEYNRDGDSKSQGYFVHGTRLPLNLGDDCSAMDMDIIANVLSPSPQAPVIASASKLIQAYKGNALAANRTYSGKAISVVGFFEGVNQGMGNEIWLKVSSEPPPSSAWNVNAAIEGAAVDVAAELNPGALIAVTCRQWIKDAVLEPRMGQCTKIIILEPSHNLAAETKYLKLTNSE
jgi:hypothetical protein